MAARNKFGLELSEPLVSFALRCGSWSSPATFKEGIAADASFNTCGPNESIPDHLQCLAQVGAISTLLWQLSQSLSRLPINVRARICNCRIFPENDMKMA
ncbi:hypothetical protein Peur_010863 [Populus x canadensis]